MLTKFQTEPEVHATSAIQAPVTVQVIHLPQAMLATVKQVDFCWLTKIGSIDIEFGSTRQSNLETFSEARPCN
jgi:hypothetical protein